MFFSGSHRVPTYAENRQFSPPLNLLPGQKSSRPSLICALFDPLGGVTEGLQHGDQAVHAVQPQIEGAAAAELFGCEAQGFQTCLIEGFVLRQKGRALTGIEDIQKKLGHEVGLIGKKQTAAETEELMTQGVELTGHAGLFPSRCEAHGLVHLVGGLMDPVVGTGGVHGRSLQEHGHGTAEDVAGLEAHFSSLKQMVLRGAAKSEYLLHRLHGLQHAWWCDLQQQCGAVYQQGGQHGVVHGALSSDSGLEDALGVVQGEEGLMPAVRGGLGAEGEGAVHPAEGQTAAILGVFVQREVLEVVDGLIEALDGSGEMGGGAEAGLDVAEVHPAGGKQPAVEGTGLIGQLAADGQGVKQSRASGRAAGVSAERRAMPRFIQTLASALRASGES